MIFDLVAGDRRLDFLDHDFQQRRGEIGDADGARAPFLLQLHQCFQHRGQFHAAGRPMHQIEVDLVEPQLLQRCIAGPADRLGRQVLVPDFCRDMKIAARDAGGRDGRADRLLVAVHFRGVDVPVAEPERALHRRAAGIALHAKGAETELGHADALCLQIVHEQTPEVFVPTGSARRCRVSRLFGDGKAVAGTLTITREPRAGQSNYRLEARAGGRHCQYPACYAETQPG